MEIALEHLFIYTVQCPGEDGKTQKLLWMRADNPAASARRCDGSCHSRVKLGGVS